MRTLDLLVHETFNSPLGESGDYEGHSVIRTENGGIWYADSVDPDDQHCDDHAEIVRRVNLYPEVLEALIALHDYYRGHMISGTVWKQVESALDKANDQDHE